MDDRVSRLERLAVAHERDIHALQDRCTFVVLVRDPAIQKKVQEARGTWQEADEQRRSAAEPADHPLGSLRSHLHEALFREAHDRIPQDRQGARQAAALLQALPKPEIDINVFRLRPKHPEPKEGRAWIFQLTVAGGAAQEYWSSLRTLSKHDCKEIQVAPQRSRDGPLVGELGKGGGKGKSRKGKDRDAMDTEEPGEARGKKKRERDGTPGGAAAASGGRGSGSSNGRQQQKKR
jgi:hypothetical protein